ncbi:MAG: molybdate ABC transporter substrate-binding protein [Clostridiaceae bacterium]
MKKRIGIIKGLILSTLMVALVGCGAKSTTETKKEETKQPVTLTISAAASLKDSMEEIKKIYIGENTNVTINYNFGGSGALQQQIEQGAESDLFISAATKQMDALKDKGLLIDDTRVNLLGNSVVLVVKSDYSGSLDFKDVDSKANKVGLGEPKSVPVGQYAEEIFTSLNTLDKVKGKAVYGKDVKEVLSWVETGNVDAGIVYATDAKASGKVKVAATASNELYKTPVVYPAAVVKASKNVDDAKAFLNFLSGTKAKEVFEKYGFEFLIK